MHLFLSHSGADTAAARELKRRILASPVAQDAGLDVWLDVDSGLRPGADGWQDQLEEAIGSARAFCVYVGSRGVVNWVEREVRLGLSAATGDNAVPFVPALAPGVDPRALPPFAQQHQAVRDPLGDPAALAALVEAALGGPTPPRLVEEPFVGLRSMDEADAPLFFGRKAEVEELVAKLRAHPLVAVVADSGAGKSSLVRAGLVPAFRGGALEPPSQPQRPDALRHVLVMRPGGDPAEGLRRAVTAAAAGLGLDGDAKASLRKRIDLADPAETPYALRCDLPPKQTDTLLVVDQLEELLTQAPRDAAERFVALLLALVDPHAQRRFRVALTIRADYFNLLSVHPALFERLSAEGGAAQMRLKRVSDEGLEAVVREPLQLAGHRDEDEAAALLAAIRQDVSDRPGDLALVQMALTAAWRAAQADRIGLTAAYARTGGALGAVAHEAERVRTEALEEGEREMLPGLMVRLVRLGDAGGATRRLVEFKALDPPRAALARRLASEEGGRLLAAGEQRVEIAHEALIAQWPWLARLVGEAAPDVRLLARLSDAAADWAASGKAAHALPNEAERRAFDGLDQRRADWLTPPERAYVRAAKGRARLRVVAAGSAAAALVALTLASGLFGARALDEAARADREVWFAKRNEMGALAALSDVALREGRPVDAVKLALAAWPRRSGDEPQVAAALSALGDALPAMRELGRLEHEGRVQSVAFLPDGARLVTGSGDGTVRVWDAATGEPLGEPLVAGGGPVESVTLSPDGTRLATESLDGTVRLWDAGTGEPLGEPLAAQQAGVGSIAVSPDGARLATGAGDRTARLWDTATGEPLGPPLMGHEDWVWSVAFSPDGTRLATGSGDGTARLWDAATGEELLRLEGHENWIWSAAFSPDGRLLATGSFDGTARLWDTATGEEVLRLVVHEEGVASVAFSPDGTQLATGSFDGTARLWDAGTGEPLGPPLGGHEGSANTSVAFAPDGARLATGAQGGAARLWDLTTSQPVAGREGSAITSVAFSPDGAQLAMGFQGGTARLWDLTGVPEGNAFAVACASLPFLNGTRHTRFPETVAEGSVEILEPICEEGYAPPLPWHLVPGGVEPQPPSARWAWGDLWSLLTR